ncbi:TPA: FdtA/QdtA family cupin domain-containing protein [Vibrio vulnificus]|nr:FdtA/QdtA family cupin domain-containing protein [Vibrio vulnificus]ELC9717429.1 FdtA/QdtA family cupin domain-containing protein [Vibrio vulnificus]ELS0762135.1 FdtA/QdtA family cupin domain-containing protein [Vibrio vulnificus]ELV8609603.1 FdtA/QdtA family cupin domain-containing protein [Vibrio vulnificus]ELV8618428.1 FdtA/QdtA family cupin domain-containing protein [Vibrio vulnificus]
MNYKLIDFNVVGDHRGKLIALESLDLIPFSIKRIYYIYDTKEDVSRGFHAHLNLQQVAVCVKGSCDFILDDGITRETVRLDSPDTGLHIYGITWREMHNFSEDCLLLVIASEKYDELDYIREYDKFKGIVENERKK